MATCGCCASRRLLGEVAPKRTGRSQGRSAPVPLGDMAFPDTPLFAALAAEYAAAAASPPGRHHWADEPRTEEILMGRHFDADGDGRADGAEHAEAESLRWESEQGWCEDRQPGADLTDHDEVE